MIAKLSWAYNTRARTLTLLKVDCTGWALNSQPEDIKKLLEFYEVDKCISLKEFSQNEKYHSIMCTIVPVHRTQTMVNV
jgi:hypothetical protein